MLKFPPGIVYVASPYTHKDHRKMQCRYEQIADFMARTTTNPAFENCFAYSPIVAWHTAALRNNLPPNAAFWMKQNQKVIDLSVALVVVTFDGWEESLGVKSEIGLFCSKGIPPVYAHFSPNGDVELWTL